MRSVTRLPPSNIWDGEGAVSVKFHCFPRGETWRTKEKAKAYFVRLHRMWGIGGALKGMEQGQQNQLSKWLIWHASFSHLKPRQRHMVKARYDLPLSLLDMTRGQKSIYSFDFFSSILLLFLLLSLLSFRFTSLPELITTFKTWKGLGVPSNILHHVHQVFGLTPPLSLSLCPNPRNFLPPNDRLACKDSTTTHVRKSTSNLIWACSWWSLLPSWRSLNSAGHLKLEYLWRLSHCQNSNICP